MSYCPIFLQNLTNQCYNDCMAKTIEEIIEVESQFGKIESVEIIEVYCGFNDAAKKTVYFGDSENIPDNLKTLKYSSVSCHNHKMKIEYTNHKSFEGRQIQQFLQIQTFQ